MDKDNIPSAYFKNCACPIFTIYFKTGKSPLPIFTYHITLLSTDVPSDVILKPGIPLLNMGCKMFSVSPESLLVKTLTVLKVNY